MKASGLFGVLVGDEIVNVIEYGKSGVARAPWRRFTG
jgi:hypothetical protein